MNGLSMFYVSGSGNVEIRGKQNSLFPKGTSHQAILLCSKTKQANFEKRAEIPATTSGLLRSRATVVNISRVRVNCLPFVVIVFAILPAHGVLRETVSLLDAM